MRAIPIAPEAILVNPNNAAINAITKKIAAHVNIKKLLVNRIIQKNSFKANFLS